MSNADEIALASVHNYGVNLRTRELFLHSYYGNDEYEDGTDYRSSITFIKNLRILENASNKNILVHMQIEGGDFQAGMAIIDAIRLCRSPVVILAYAQASSMSGIILQAAKKRVLMPNCEFLMH